MVFYYLDSFSFLIIDETNHCSLFFELCIFHGGYIKK